MIAPPAHPPVLPPSNHASLRRRVGGVLVAVASVAGVVAVGSHGGSAGTSLSVAATHDAAVNEASPAVNYGSRSELRVRNGSRDWRTLLQFDVAGLAAPATATLRLAVTDPTYSGGTIYAIANEWDEATVTWSSAPQPLGPPLAVIGAVATGQLIDVPIGSVPGDGRYSFVVSAGANNSAVYASGESATPPTLVLTPEGTPTTAPVPTPTTSLATTTTTALPTTTTTTVPATATTTTTTAPAVTAPGTTTSSPAASAGEIWVDAAQLASRPMSGAAWTRLKERADGSLGTPDIADQNSNHDINTLAVALVAARTGDGAYRLKAAIALMSVIGTENNPDPNCSYTPSRARAMSLGRNLLSYVVAADVLNFRATADPTSAGSRFSAWVDHVRFAPNCPNTGSGTYPDGKWLNLSQEHDSSGSNGSSMAGASRIAAAAYLGDTAELQRAWATYRRFAGDRSVGPDLTFNTAGLTWSHNPSAPVAVNPAGTTSKDGHRIDGAIINDIGRGGAYTWAPGYTQYQWEGTAGFIAQAQLLAQAGYPAWTVQSSAPRRVIGFSLYLSNQLGTAWWDHSDWTKYLVNHVYDIQLRIDGPANEGKNMAWTDWTFGP